MYTTNSFTENMARILRLDLRDFAVAKDYDDIRNCNLHASSDAQLNYFSPEVASRYRYGSCFMSNFALTFFSKKLAEVRSRRHFWTKIL
jgi:hypothetical protein